MSNYESQQLERIPVEIYEGADHACTALAEEIALLIRERSAEGRQVVLGLATGSTPVRLYRELIRLHNETGLSFKNVITFNLDEYYGLEPSHPESYRRFMQDQLFDHVDILPENTNVPSGMVERSEVFAHCEAYEEAIRESGGIDLQILGIGRTGHIGFNEPGSGVDSRTRLVILDALTRRDAARDFLGEENVPRYAITMGVGTIREARKIALLAWGENKAEVLANAVEEAPVESLPASFLQGHPDVRFLVDESAASFLTRFRHPWLVGSVEWTPARIRQSVLWLAQKVQKPILKLVDADYSEHGMAELLTECAPAYDINIRIFNETQHTITGWPGGKPNADDSNRPERANPHSKRVVAFSPEPLDDVNCMGGTLNRLLRQGHDVQVVYQTSGNLAVPDEEVSLTTDLLVDLGVSGGGAPEWALKVRDQLATKNEFEMDPIEIRRLKGGIRRSEARAAGGYVGLKADQLKFLEMPFYEKGRYRRFKLEQEDVDVMVALLQEVKPHQIYATGFRADPSSVPAICFNALQQALEALSGEAWLKDCRVWLYRGMGEEWELHEIDMAVPFSPGELSMKVHGIYQHRSQRSQAPSTGHEKEAWNLASNLNRGTAAAYDAIGMAEYEALEAFKSWPIS